MSFRLFPRNNFSLQLDDVASDSPFIEHQPTGLLFCYTGENGETTRMTIDLDIYEMLYRLNSGYRPTIEDLQGFYQGLSVFKNRLAAATYSKLVLTVTGHSFYGINQSAGEVLELKSIERQGK
jgi:hypothetical protein